ncbi:MAG: DNA endonuclease SmrA [Pseudomonadota bacterium]|nr:DNA endonuclease SmrA [Pseudomonadota bacterium]
MGKKTDLELFLREVGDTLPLKQTERVYLRATTEDSPGQRYRRETQEREVLQESRLSTDFAEPLGPEDTLSFKRDGVQNGVFRKLRQGRYPVEATLDLHRRTVEEARNDVLSFIRRCARLDVRSVLISHGKGIRSDSYPVIKSFLAKWLPTIEGVIAFHSAQSFHGGTGSVYVMLRKSQKQQEINGKRFLNSR